MECITPLDPAVQLIAISVVFLALLPYAWTHARRSEIKVRPGFLETAKLVRTGLSCQSFEQRDADF